MRAATSAVVSAIGRYSRDEGRNIAASLSQLEQYPPSAPAPRPPARPPAWTSPAAGMFGSISAVRLLAAAIAAAVAAAFSLLLCAAAAGCCMCGCTCCPLCPCPMRDNESAKAWGVRGEREGGGTHLMHLAVVLRPLTLLPGRSTSGFHPDQALDIACAHQARSAP